MMTPQQMHALAQQMLIAASLDATAWFDETVSPVRRVAIKANPAVTGQFLVMAVLQNGQRYEGRIQSGKRGIDWCATPNCNCMGFARTRSRFELGATIED